MVVRYIDSKNGSFLPKEIDEQILSPEVPYLNVIYTLIYLTQCTRPDVSFSSNLLAWFSSESTRRHWHGIKHIFRYLRETINLSLFYSNDLIKNPSLVVYADIGYLSDPHKACSQTGYIFTFNGVTIS